MPHVAFVPLTGLRVREAEMLELGMRLPGLRDRMSALAELPSLGLLTLAGMLPEEWTCSYHPAQVCDDELIQQIVSERPTIVAVSALTASIEEAYRLSARLRAENLKVVLGGLHATVCADEANRHADAVVVGAGESVWHSVLSDSVAGTLRPQYVASIHDDDHCWPLPRFDLVGGRPPRYTVQSQRGCPLACDFCGASRLLGSFREKPAAVIRRELDAISRLVERPVVELADDNTFAGTRDVDELFDVLEPAGIRYFTEADWRIGERLEILRRLAASGCYQVLMGIESLVFRYPGMGDKQAELSRVLKAVDAIQESGVVVNACFIVGAEGETQESMDRLAAFIERSGFGEVQLTLQTPFPGTGLYRRLKKAGRLLHDRGWSHCTLFDVTYEPDRMSVEELEQVFRALLGQVFSETEAKRRRELCKQIWRRR